MWIIFGNELKTERVRHGARVERHCQHCDETTVHYERVAATKLSLYFIELLEYGKRRVMACGACNTLYATDELGQPDAPSTGAERVLAAAEKAGAEISVAAKDAFGKLSAAAKDGLNQLSSRSEPARRPEREVPSHDPLADDQDALEAKFRDLEKKYRIGD